MGISDSLLLDLIILAIFGAIVGGLGHAHVRRQALKSANKLGDLIAAGRRARRCPGCAGSDFVIT